MPNRDVFLELAPASCWTSVRRRAHLHNITASTPAGSPLIVSPPLPHFPLFVQHVNIPSSKRFTPLTLFFPPLPAFYFPLWRRCDLDGCLRSSSVLSIIQTLSSFLAFRLNRVSLRAASPAPGRDRPSSRSTPSLIALSADFRAIS